MILIFLPARHFLDMWKLSFFCKTLFCTHLFFRLTSRSTLLWPLTCRIPRPTRTQPQDVGHLCLRYCKFVNPFYNLIGSAWERAPWRRDTEKSHLFYSKRRSGRDQKWNPGHLRGKQRRKTLSHPLRFFAKPVSAMLNLTFWQLHI
jgi:hypothetical protein